MLILDIIPSLFHVRAFEFKFALASIHRTVRCLISIVICHRLQSALVSNTNFINTI